MSFYMKVLLIDKMIKVVYYKWKYLFRLLWRTMAVVIAEHHPVVWKINLEAARQYSFKKIPMGNCLSISKNIFRKPTRKLLILHLYTFSNTKVVTHLEEMEFQNTQAFILNTLILSWHWVNSEKKVIILIFLSSYILVLY